MKPPGQARRIDSRATEAAATIFGEPPGLLDSIGFETLAAAVAAGIAVVRFERLAWANDTFVSWLGASVSEIRKVPFSGLFKDIGRGLPDRNDFHATECGIAAPDGSMRRVRCTPFLRDRDSDLCAWLLEDATRVRDLEYEILTLSRQLHERNREVAALEDRIRNERTDREEMLGVVSHELRTPLTIVGGYNRLLLSGEVGPLTDDQRRYLEESSEACRRVNDFITRLLEAPAAHADGAFLEISRQALGDVIRTEARGLTPLLSDRDLAIAIAVAPEADVAQFDRGRIGQVIRNLLENAIKYAPAGSSIEIQTQRIEAATASDRDAVEVAVSDRGPGIDEADRERIFEAYVRAANARSEEGYGLGLAVCRRLIEAHGGSIAVTNRVGGGSRFAFSLPDDAAGRGR